MQVTLDSQFFGPEKSVLVSGDFEDIASGLTLKATFTDDEVTHVIEAEVASNPSKPDTDTYYDYHVTVKTNSPLFEPALINAKLVTTEEKYSDSFESSLSVRHGDVTHSVSGKHYQRFEGPYGKVYSTVINVTSPYLTAENNSLESYLDIGGSNITTFVNLTY